MRDAQFELKATSLIKFKSIPVNEFPKASWYFFYSRNGVYFGLRQLADRSLLSNIKVGTMGKGTAQQYHAMTGKEADFIGSGNPENVAVEFLKIAEGSSVVFVRASKSLQSVQQALKGKVTDIDLVTYENTIDENITIPQTDMAAFTSPMNVDAYFKYKTFETPKTLIALGKSTKLAIAKYTDQKVLVPNEPSEASLKALIDSILE